MELIPGGLPEQERHLTNSVVSSAHGELLRVVEAIESRSSSVRGALENLNIDETYTDWIIDSFDKAQYRVVAGESVATDLEIILGANLPDQLAKARGADSVKIHLSVFGAVSEAVKYRELPEGASPQWLTWTFELGRYAGKLLHRRAAVQLAPLGLPHRFGMSNFFNRLTEDLYGDDNGIEIDESIVSERAIDDYYMIGLPERLATSMGNYFLEHFFGCDENLLGTLEAHLRDATIKPYQLAQDFGNEFRPELSYRELAASHPFSPTEFKNYLEYVTATSSDTIYLQDL